tara:strand:+ start:53014 stop:53643 length:630 start_codon:yes stop_codon:yes gene_type:complete
MNQPYLIGIAGNSGAGKTTLAQSVADVLGDSSAAIVSLDSYYLDDRNAGDDRDKLHNYDSPAALDLELLTCHLRTLVNGQPIEQPVYDFQLHRRNNFTTTIEPTQIIIVEGRLTFYHAPVRTLLSTKVFLSAHNHTCYKRRLIRDRRERGRTEESIHTQWKQSVEPMFVRYVEPTKKHANINLNGEQTIAILTKSIIRHLKSDVQLNLS